VLGNNVMIAVVLETQWHACGKIFERERDEDYKNKVMMVISGTYAGG